MRTFTNKFRQNLQEIRELYAKITYIKNNQEIVLTEEDLNSINPLFKASLFKTVCKSVEIDSTTKLPVGTRFKVEIGAKVNNNIEYMNYGYYYVVTEPTYQADKKSYLITAYDNMVNSMIEYNLNVTYPITIKNLLIAICNHFNWQYDFTQGFINENEIINKNVFANQDITYRDVLDDISEVSGGNLLFTNGDVLTIKYINNQNVNQYEITEEDLKNINVDVSETVGPINYVAITSNNVELAVEKDATSIEINGKNKFAFVDNYIFQNDYSLLASTFEEIKYLFYYTFDFETIGNLVFEPLDLITASIYESNYPILILNDDVKYTGGLTENIYTEKLEAEETEETITVTDKATKKLNDALIRIEKSSGQIVLKATSDGKLVQAELNADADEGSEFNLVADRIKIQSNNFTLDYDGTITSVAGFIGGWEITENGLKREIKPPYDYSESDLTKIQQYLTGRYTPTADELKKFDVDNNGIVDILDYVVIRKLVTYNLMSSNPGQLLLNTNDWFNPIKILNSNGDILNQFGVYDKNQTSSSITDHGSCTLNSNTTVSVEFNKSFSSTPSVCLTPNTSASGVITGKLRSVSSTGFTAIIGGTVSGNVKFDWIAIGE